MKVVWLNLILVLSSLLSHSQNTLEIFFNVDYCNNCNNFFSQLNELNPSIKKTVYAKESSKDYIKDVLSKYPINSDTYTIDYVPESFFIVKKGRKSDAIESYCLYKQNKVILDSFLLKNISLKINGINSLDNSNKANFDEFSELLPQKTDNQTPGMFFMNKKTNKLYFPAKITYFNVPDSIKFSVQAKLFYENGKVNIVDNVLNKNVLFDLNKSQDSIISIFQIRGEQFHNRLFFRFNAFDTSVYKATFPVLKKLGISKPFIHQAYVNDSSLFLLLELKYPKVNQNKTLLYDTIISSEMFLYSRSLALNTKKLIYINGLAFSEAISGTVILPFYVYKHSTSLTAFNDADTSIGEYNYLLKYELKDDKLNKPQVIKSQLRGLNNPRKNEGFVIAKGVNNRFYFAVTSPFIYDYIEEKEYYLPESELEANCGSEYFIKDVIRDGDLLKLIIEFKSEHIRLDYSIKENKVKNKVPIYINPELPITQIKFFRNSPKEVIILTKNKLGIMRIIE